MHSLVVLCILLKKLRTLIQKSPWRKATLAPYRDAPHIILFWNKKPWQWFSDQINGEYKTCRGRYKYPLLDGDCFWVDLPALNLLN